MSRALTPYPRFGECITVLASALDVNKAGSDVGRLAREGDFGWEELDAVIQELLVDGCARVLGDAAQRFLAPWVALTRKAYTRLVLDESLDGVGRNDALPVLIEGFFAPAAAVLMQRIHAAMPGPDLTALLAQSNAPVKATLEWLDDMAGAPVEKWLYPGTTGSDRVEQEKVRKWRSGVDIPSSQSILLLSKRLNERCAVADSCAMWLLLSSALARLERAWGKPLRPLIHLQLEGGLRDTQPLAQRLSELVQRAGRAWPELAKPGAKLWHELRRTSQKSIGDQERTWDEIKALEQTASTSDPEGRLAYHFEWMKGRWHVLSGQYREALPYYSCAVKLACYRAGPQVQDLIKESSCIAAFLGKRAFLKRLKHVGIAFGLFRRPGSGLVLEDWEFDQFVQQLPRLFPAQGRFVEGLADLTDHPQTGLLLCDGDTVSKSRPDLKSVNSVRAVHFASGEVRRWPQLRLFASFGMADHVRCLLNAGASVDDLDSSGGSALLCALQHATSTGQREVLDLLMARPHQVATINALTHRKRLTPLMCAIDLGQPDVVEALVAQGADVEQRAQTDHQSPLYYLVSQLFYKVHPERIVFTLSQRMMRDPDEVMQDTLRRFGVSGAGTFGSAATGHGSGPEQINKQVQHLVSEHVARHTVSNLMRIAALLLKAGANPNAPHAYPEPGRTPLMLAAESDLPELFTLMVEHGGNPLMPDARGQDCAQIARSFRAAKVLNCLGR